MPRKTKEDYRVAATRAYRLLSNISSSSRERAMHDWTDEAMETLRRVVYDGLPSEEDRNGWPAFVVNVGGDLHGPFNSEYAAKRYGDHVREDAKRNGISVGGSVRRLHVPVAPPRKERD